MQLLASANLLLLLISCLCSVTSPSNGQVEVDQLQVEPTDSEDLEPLVLPKENKRPELKDEDAAQEEQQKIDTATLPAEQSDQPTTVAPEVVITTEAPPTTAIPTTVIPITTAIPTTTVSPTPTAIPTTVSSTAASISTTTPLTATPPTEVPQEETTTIVATTTVPPTTTQSPTTTTTTLSPADLSERCRKLGGKKYAVAVDCGSSGSRARLFEWPWEAKGEEMVRQIRVSRDKIRGEPLSKAIKPGLAHVRENPDAASDYVRPIMEFARENVPDECRSETAVFFMGTAGMRSLTDLEQKGILDDISRDVRKEFDEFGPIHAEVLSGKKEGANMWLSVNVNANRMDKQFDQSETAFGFYTQRNTARRYGMLEMGGASAQVTFEVSSEKMDELVGLYLMPFQEAKSVFKQSRVDYEFEQQDGDAKKATNSSSRGNGRDNFRDEFKLFSVSFLGFGSESARSLAIDLLVKDAVRLKARLSGFGASFVPFAYSTDSTFVVEDPCLPSGADELHLKPIELLFDDSRTIGFEPTDGQNLHVRLIGRGNYLLCRNLLIRMVSLAKQERTNCRHKTVAAAPCESTLIGTNFVPWLQLQFIGLGDLFYTTREILKADGRFNAPLVQMGAIRTCATNYATLQSSHPEADRFDTSRTRLECFKATWILTWLQFALNMPLAADLTTTSRLGAANDEVHWNLGAMLDKLATRRPQPAPQTS